MSTTGYTSISITKESGAAPLPIPAGVWTTVFAQTDCAEGPNIITGQLYFEGVTLDTVIAVRVSRGPGDATGQHDTTAGRTTWALSYFDLDFVQAGNTTRGMEVWAEKTCILRTHNLKILNPAAYIAARITVEQGD